MPPTTKFILEADEAKAVQGFLRILDAQKKTEDGMKKIGAAGKESGNILSDAMDKSARSVKNFIIGFATIGGIIAEIRALVGHLKEIVELRSKLAGTAQSVEQIGLKLAALRGDVSKAGVENILKETTAMAVKANIPLEMAAKIRLSAETIMGKGTPAAAMGAEAIAKFAGPAGLTEAEVDNLSRLFILEGARTREAQEKVLNKMMGAIGVSRVGPGEFITPFVTGRIAEQRKGFTLEQSLAGMVAAIETTGSAEAAATSREQLINLLAMPRAAGFKFLRTEGRKAGIDYEKLTEPQRIEFGRRIYGEYEARGELDRMRLKIGARGGFEALEAQFGKAATGKQAEAMAAMQQETDYVNKLAGAYKELLTARSAVAATTIQAGKYETGKEFLGGKILDEMAQNYMEKIHARLGIVGTFGEFHIPDFIEKAFIKRAIIKSNLTTAGELAPAGSEERENIRGLATQSTFGNMFNPEYLERTAKVTNDFQLSVQNFSKAVDTFIKALTGGSVPIGPHIGAE